ncbi:hypothetical protein FQR65_LT08531 [Abscondita terminalis]|nr:hypothetical protein FQR65_LT08531 [Abscondita terminalis]
MGKNKTGLNSNRSEFVSEADDTTSDQKKHNGCFVSTKKAIILAVFAILSLLAVGAIIYFYGAKYNKNQEDSNDLEMLLNTSISNLEYEDFRLPTHISPLHYRLRIHPYLYEADTNNFSFYGEVTILIRCKKSTKTIIFHSDNLKIAKDEVKVTIRKDTYFKPVAELPLDKVNDIIKGDIKNLSLGTASDSLSGILNIPVVIDVAANHSALHQTRSETKSDLPYVVHKIENLKIERLEEMDFKYASSTIFARRMFPCFDEPSFKASFEVSVARKTNMSSVSNMPLKESELMQNKSGWIWDHFESSPPMSPHLLAFTVFDFDYIKPNTSEVGPVFKLWAQNICWKKPNTLSTLDQKY